MAYLQVTKLKIDSTPPPQEQLSTPKMIGPVDRLIKLGNIFEVLMKTKGGENAD